MFGKYSLLGIVSSIPIACLMTAPLAAEGSLYISYPPADYQTATDRIFVIGSAPSEGYVSINNQPVPRSKKGHFASVFNLKVGKNTFEIDYKNQHKRSSSREPPARRRKHLKIFRPQIRSNLKATWRGMPRRISLLWRIGSD